MPSFQKPIFPTDGILSLSALSTFLTLRHYRIVILRNNIAYLSNIISGSDLFVRAKRWSYSVEGQSSIRLPRLVTFYFCNLTLQNNMAYTKGLQLVQQSAVQ